MNQQIDSSMEDVISMLLGASLDFREKMVTEMNGQHLLFEMPEEDAKLLGKRRAPSRRKGKANQGSAKAEVLDIEQMSFMRSWLNPKPTEVNTTVVETVEWTDSDIEDLHHGLIIGTLKVLDDGRSSPASRDLAWEWVSATGVYPFSFDACCQLEGVNPTKFRQELYHNPDIERTDAEYFQRLSVNQ